MLVLPGGSRVGNGDKPPAERELRAHGGAGRTGNTWEPVHVSRSAPAGSKTIRRALAPEGVAGNRKGLSRETSVNIETRKGSGRFAAINVQQRRKPCAAERGFARRAKAHSHYTGQFIGPEHREVVERRSTMDYRLSTADCHAHDRRRERAHAELALWHRRHLAVAIYGLHANRRSSPDRDQPRDRFRL